MIISETINMGIKNAQFDADCETVPKVAKKISQKLIS